MAKVTMREGENDFVGGLVFHKRVKNLMEELPKEEEIIVDLNNYYIDSSLIGTLLALHASCCKGDRAFKVTGVSEASAKVLRLSGIDKVLTIIPKG
jgi:anti-anti-sigma factor